MKALFCVILSVSLSAGAQQIPALTVKGESFTNVTITNVTASRATLYFEGGGKRVLISDLPIDIQHQLHYNPAAARASLDMEATRSEQTQTRNLEAWRAANCRMLNGALVETRSLETVEGRVLSVLGNGVNLFVWQSQKIYVPTKEYAADNSRNGDGEASIGGMMLGARPTIIPGHYVMGQPRPYHYFVQCQTNKIVPGQQIHFLAKRDGDHYIASTPYLPTP